MSTTLAWPGRGPYSWRLAAATVLAALAGVGAAAVLARDEPQVAAPSAPAPAPRIGLASGPARLPLPPGWTPLHRRSTLPGLETATAVRTGYGEAALDIRMPEDASLLPGGVTPALFEGPEPRRLGDRSVWRYGLGEPRPGTAAVALVLPSTAGVVTIACAPRRRSSTGRSPAASRRWRACGWRAPRRSRPTPEPPRRSPRRA